MLTNRSRSTRRGARQDDVHGIAASNASGNPISPDTRRRCVRFQSEVRSPLELGNEHDIGDVVLAASGG